MTTTKKNVRCCKCDRVLLLVSSTSPVSRLGLTCRRCRHTGDYWVDGGGGRPWPADAAGSTIEASTGAGRGR